MGCLLTLIFNCFCRLENFCKIDSSHVLLTTTYIPNTALRASCISLSQRTCPRASGFTRYCPRSGRYTRAYKEHHTNIGIERILDILPGLKVLGNNRAVAPRRVDISQPAATSAVVLYWPTCPFKVSDCPPATNIFLLVN